jgi:rod shape-determining protein MreC
MARSPRAHHDVIRRRRAFLVLLICALVIAVTAVAGGPLRDVRNGASAVLGPIGDGAGRAAKPISNLFGWINDTVTSKGKVGDTRSERDAFRSQAIREQAAAGENPQLRGLVLMDRQPVDLRPYRPVTAKVLVRSATLWYTKIGIGSGSEAGIRADMPVISADGAGPDDGGLIGKVESVTAGAAVVRLLTNASVAVGVKTAGGDSAGTLVTSPSNPRDLELTGVPGKAAVAPNTLLVTEGTTSKRRDLQSLYPPDLQIGRVSRIDDEGTLDQKPHVRLFVDTRVVRYVQVLTRKVDGNR